MRTAIGLAVGVTLALALASGPQVWAHGGGGGGHGGGGGGGHGGGFGGGGFGGGHGGFGGGFHSGGFGGYSGGMRGLSTPSFGGQSYSGAARSFSSSPLRSLSGPSNMHGLSGLSGRGNLSSSATSFQARHSGGMMNSLGTHSLGTNKGLTGNSAIHHVSLSNAASRGNLPQNLHAARTLNHQSNLGRQNNLNNLNNFASHRNNAFNNGMNRGAFNHNRNFFFFPFFGFGFPFFGYGYWPYGYGYGYGYGGYGYGYGYPYYGYNAYCGYGGYGAYAAAPAATNASDLTEAEQYAQQGEADFMTGNYTGAMHAWRHAIVDDPNNGVLVMMMAQALFANGTYDEAAGAVQQAMLTLPEDQWGVVVTNYRELYPDIQKYTDQLRALEKAIKEKDDSPALHFLLGYHYGYLGFPRDAVVQLAKVKELAPNDQMAAKLFDQMSAKIPKPASPVPDQAK